MENKSSFWDWLSSRTNVPSSTGTDYDQLNWKVSVVRNGFQIIVYFLTIFLPWYRLYRPYGSVIIDAGPLQMRPEALAFLLLSIILSFIIGIRVFITKRPKKRDIRLMEFGNVFLVFFLLSVVGNPVFLPGLGDRYSDFISLQTLSFAGYQIIPMLGYITLLLGMASVIGGLLYSFFM